MSELSYCNVFDVIAKSNSNLKILDCIVETIKKFKYHTIKDVLLDPVTKNAKAVIFENTNSSYSVMLQVDKNIIYSAISDNKKIEFEVSDSLYSYVPIKKNNKISPIVKALDFDVKLNFKPSKYFQIIEYYDSILITFKKSKDSEYWYKAFHAGRILNTRKSDHEIGLSGIGMLSGIPSMKRSLSSYDNTWISRNSNSSIVKISNASNENWVRPDLLIELSPSHASNVNNYTRLGDIIITCRDSNAILGSLRYIKQYKNPGGHNTIINSFFGKNSWLRYRYANTDNHTCMFWKK